MAKNVFLINRGLADIPYRSPVWNKIHCLENNAMDSNCDRNSPVSNHKKLNSHAVPCDARIFSAVRCITRLRNGTSTSRHGQSQLSGKLHHLKKQTNQRYRKMTQARPDTESPNCQAALRKTKAHQASPPFQHTNEATNVFDALKLWKSDANLAGAVCRHRVCAHGNARLPHSRAHGSQPQVQSKHKSSDKMTSVDEQCCSATPTSSMWLHTNDTDRSTSCQKGSKKAV